MFSERDSAQLFDRMPFAAIVRALETNLTVAVNREFERVTGYVRGELLGRHPSEIGLYPDERDFEQKVTRLSQEGKLLDATIAIRKKSGEIVEATYAAAIIPVDRAAFILAVFQAFRERRAAKP